MPDMTPVGNTIIPPNPMTGINTMTGILGMQQQRQALQTGTYLQQSAQADAQQAQQKNQELARAQAIAIEGAKNGTYTNDDGSLNRQQMADDITKVAPTYGGTITTSLLSNANEIVANRKAHQELDVSQQQQMGSTFGALATKKDLTPTDFIDALNTLTDHNKDPAFKRMSLSMAASVPPNATPQQLQELARRWGIASTSPESSTGQTNPNVSTMQAPGGLQPVNTNPQAPGGTGPVGAPMEQGVGPGAQLVTDQSGAQFLLNQQKNTVTPVGAGKPAPANAPPNQSFRQPSYPGQDKDIETFRTEVQNVRQEAQQAPLARNINAQILNLSKDAKTGPGTEAWQHVIGAVGAPFGLSPSASYQEVGKFLEKNAIANMQSMGGPPSDSRLDAAAKANGSTSFSPEALRTVTKFNDATTTALDQYRQGIDHAVGMGQNVDYTKLPAFKSAWAKNFDVNVFRVENALRDGDTAELDKLKSELGPAGLKALAAKRKNLTALSQGQMPQ